MPEEPSTTIEFEGFRLDACEMRLWRGAELLHVAPKAMEILIHLLDNRGEVVSREELMDKVWGDAFVEDGNLNVHISNLRRTLSENCPEPVEFIQTVPKHGYRFLPEIVKVSAGKDPIPEVDVPSQAFTPGRTAGKRQVRWHFLGIVLLGMLLVSSFTLWLGFAGDSALSGVPIEDRNIRSLAVLPLKDLNEQQRTRVLSLGITDSLISRLGSLNRFRVRPLNAVSKYPENGLDPIAFGKELLVDAALVGTIQESDGRLRLNVRVIDVRDGAVLWTDSFDETSTDLLELQDLMSIRVANGLLAKITKGESQILTRRITDDPAAYRSFLQGKYFMDKRTDAGLRRSVGFFEEALKADPDFAEAYVGLADAKWLLSEGQRGYSSPREVIQGVRKSIARALEIDPNLAEAYTTLADIQMYHDWDRRSAESNFLKAIRMNPNLEKAHHWYAWLLIADKRFKEADKHLRIALELNPTSLIIATERGYPAFAEGDFERSIGYFKAAADMDPGFLDAHIGLFRAYRAQRDLPRVAGELEKIKQCSSEDSVIYTYHRGLLLASEGKVAAAMSVLAELERRRVSGEYVSPIYLAALSLEVGDKEKALMWLTEGFNERNDTMPFLLVTPEFSPLFKDSRFQDLYSRMGLNR